MLITLYILEFFWYKLIYTCTQQYICCLIIVSGCSATFQALVLSDTDGTFFFTFLVSSLFQTWNILAQITWSFDWDLTPSYLGAFLLPMLSYLFICKIRAGVLLHFNFAIICFLGFFLGGSFQKSSASYYGERSSAWASRGAQQDTGIFSWSSDSLSVCLALSAVLVKALSLFQLLGI